MALSAAGFNVVPSGFFAANEVLNALPASLLVAITTDSVTTVVQPQAKADHTKYHQLLPSSPASAPASPTPALSVSQIESGVTAAFFIYSHAHRAKLSADALTSLLQSETVLSAAAISTFAKSWAAGINGCGGGSGSGGGGAAALQQTLKLGRLIDIDWKLGVAVASSHSKQIGEPFASLRLHLADTNTTTNNSHSTPGTAKSNSRETTSVHTVELNLVEFNQFAASFKTIALRLNTA